MNIYNIIVYVCIGHTINDACAHFGCSKSYIMKEFKKIRTPGTEDYNPVLAEKLKLAMTRNSLLGRKHGGAVSKKTEAITDEYALELKRVKEDQKLSYRELEDMTGISYSTIRLAIERVSNTEEQKRGR